MLWVVWVTIHERVPIPGVPGRVLLPRDIPLGQVEAPDAARAHRAARQRFVSLRATHPLRVQSLVSWQSASDDLTPRRTA